MTNGEYLTKNQMRYEDLNIERRQDKPGYVVYYGGKPIGHMANYAGSFTALLMWLDQERAYLDSTERRYLRTVIQPFRDKVTAIIKTNTIYGRLEDMRNGTERIVVKVSGGSLFFPPFPAGTMYKGLRLKYEYEPEDIGL